MTVAAHRECPSANQLANLDATFLKIALDRKSSCLSKDWEHVNSTACLTYSNEDGNFDHKLVCHVYVVQGRTIRVCGVC
jgi:hypothetical protein